MEEAYGRAVAGKLGLNPMEVKQLAGISQEERALATAQAREPAAKR